MHVGGNRFLSSQNLFYRTQSFVQIYVGHLTFLFFSAHLSTECSVSYCDHSPSISICPSVHYFLVNTLASTNINHMTLGSRMSHIMEVIERELSELSALELENLPYLTLFTL